VLRDLLYDVRLPRLLDQVEDRFPYDAPARLALEPERVLVLR
jgi:hypothetical protein